MGDWREKGGDWRGKGWEDWDRELERKKIWNGGGVLIREHRIK